MSRLNLLLKFKRFVVARSAAVIFESCTKEFYDCENLPDDKYAELRRKVAEQPQSSLMLVHLKNRWGNENAN